MLRRGLPPSAPAQKITAHRFRASMRSFIHALLMPRNVLCARTRPCLMASPRLRSRCRFTGPSYIPESAVLRFEDFMEPLFDQYGEPVGWIYAERFILDSEGNYGALIAGEWV